MLSVMAAWLYISILCLIFGSTIEYGISFLLENNKVTSAEKWWESGKQDGISIGRILFCGITFLSVYGTVFSFFGGLGSLANVGLLVLGCICFISMVSWRVRVAKTFGAEAVKDMAFPFTKLLQGGKLKWLKSGVILLGFVLFAYFSSRGYEHYDTLLYHAQAIHYLEDYGTITGLGNVYFRYAYNSASFVLNALFSFSFLGGQSMHCISGLFVWFLWIGIVEDWKISLRKKWMTSDLIRLGAIYYICMILTEIVSPASDYPTMLLVFFIFLQFTLALEREESVISLGKICVLACFAVTLKTSAAPIVLLTLYPAVLLLQKKDGRKIAAFLLLGLGIVVPYLLRGYLLSGYLLYPSDFMGALSPSWQMNRQILSMDAAEISAWGKGIEYETDWNMSFLQWFPIWLSRQKTALEKLLTLLGMGCCLPMGILSAAKVLGKKKELGRSVSFVTMIVSFLFWLFMAPLPRYGWCYLFLLPILLGGVLLEKLQEISFLQKNAIKKDVSGQEKNTIQGTDTNGAGSFSVISAVCVVALILLGLWKGAAVVKMFLGTKELPYYVRQQDYSAVNMREATQTTKSGEVIRFYEPENGLFGYYDFPAVKSVEDFVFRGDSIKQGFEAKK